MKITNQMKGVSYSLRGSTSSTAFSKGGYRGKAKATIVITDAMLKMMIEVTEEYLEKDNIVTKANAHSKMRKNNPRPIPSTLGPSSAIKSSSF